MQRWIACYMLYDWNICHAYFSFDNNEFGRYQYVCEKLKGIASGVSSTEETVSGKFVALAQFFRNKVLMPKLKEAKLADAKLRKLIETSIQISDNV